MATTSETGIDGLLRWHMGHGSSMHEDMPNKKERHTHPKAYAAAQMSLVALRNATATCASSWRLLGLGFYWGWLMLAFYSPALAPQAQAASLVQNIWTWSAWAHAGTLLGIAALARSLGVLAAHRSTRLIVPILAAVATALIPLGYTQAVTAPQLTVALVSIGSFLTGVATALLVLMWSEAYQRYKFEHATFGIIGSYLVSALIYALSHVLPPSLCLAFTIASPIVAGVFLCSTWGTLQDTLYVMDKESTLQTNAPNDTNAPRHHRTLRARVAIPLAATFLYALMGEMLRGFSVFSDTNGGLIPMGDLYVTGCALGTAFLGLVLSALRIRHVPDQANPLFYLRPVLLVMAVGFVITGIFNSSFVFAYAIFGAAFQCCRVMVWLYSHDIAMRTGISPLRVFGLSQGSFALAAAVGAPFAHALAVMFNVGEATWSTIALVVIFLIFASAVFVLNPRDLETAWGLVETNHASSPQQSDGSRSTITSELRIDDMARTYGLSPRETDVARLLAKGRSLPFIMSELHIAKSTAETHVDHIYKKLSIHTRQEFLDIVEGYTDPQT